VHDLNGREMGALLEIIGPGRSQEAQPAPKHYIANPISNDKEPMMQRVMQGDGEAVLHLCGCGKLHLTYGPLTLHFEQAEFIRFAGEVGRLATRLQHVIADREPVLMPGQNGPVCH
jgi:hypothetical protein